MTKTRRNTLIVLCVLLVLTALKLYKIDGGFVPAEPDERNYLNMVSNFHLGPLAQFDGVPLYHSPPFFHYLGFVFSFLFDGYLALRLVSLVASSALSLALYFYLRKRTTPFVAAFSSAYFLVLPITVYYSRLGLLEMLVALFAFGFIAAFHRAWEKNSVKWAFVSGLSLGFGLLTKYSILPLTGVPVVVFGLYLLEKLVSEKSLRFLKSKDLYQKISLLVVLGFGATLVAIPVTYFNYTLNPFEFKSQIKQDLALGGRPFEFAVVLQYLRSIPDYFFWVPFGFLVVGIWPLLKNWRQYLPVILGLLFLSYALVRIALYTPRYFVILVPFLVVVMALGISQVRSWLKVLHERLARVEIFRSMQNTTEAKGVKDGLFFAGLSLTLGASILQAFDGSHHTVIEEVGQYVKAQNVNDQWVASNYWPSAFADQVGYKISWYSMDHADSNALSSGGKTKYLPPNEPLYDIIKREGGWVIVEELFSKEISQRRDRSGPVEILQKAETPLKVFEDTASNWPYQHRRANKISVYHLQPK